MPTAEDGVDERADGPHPRDVAGLYDEAPCGLLSTGTDGRIQHANRTFCDWVGRPREALVDGLRLQDLLAIGSRIFHQTHWSPLLQLQGSIAEVQLEMLHSDGRVLPVLVNAAVRGAGDTLRHDVAVMIATDRKKYERELLTARRRAEELFQALAAHERQAQQRALLAEQLVGIVSHDLRNPLNAVLLSATVLARGDLDDMQSRAVGAILTATRRANLLLADLLDLTQARLGGGLRISPRSIDLHRVVADSLDELRAAWPNRVIDHVTVGDGLGTADPDRLAQMLGNLVGNAVAYGAPGEPVTVRTVGAGAGGALAIEVHNVGSPIPAELLPHLFEPMRRGEGEIGNGSRSIGLGLYIVSAIAAAHGGAVAVRSTAREGTRFTLTLPPSDRLPGI